MVRLVILLLLDPGQHLAETLFLDDGRVADALQQLEGAIGQGQSLPADLQPTIGKVIDVDQLACQCRHICLGRVEEPEFLSVTASYCRHKFSSRMRDHRRGAHHASTKDLGTCRTNQEYRGN
jgi:hypothetical protein